MRELLDQAGSYTLAVVVHAVAASVLVLSVQWPGLKPSVPEAIESVQATVVDEKRVQVELQRIRDRETAKRREEEDRAEVAREQRAHEERRLADIRDRRQQEEDESRQEAERLRKERERLLEERDQAELERERANAERQAEERRRQEAEVARLAEERRRQEVETARRAEEQRRREAEAARVAEERRRQEAEAARLAEERRGQEAKAASARAEERRRKEVEQARRRRELEMARLGAKEERRAEAERQRREEERSRRELMAREQERLEQARKAIFAKALEEYIGAIQSSVARNWRRPTGVPSGLKCTVNVVQANNGEVLRVEITQSSGNVAFDRSVEQAVLAASPLPPPKQRAVFDRQPQELTRAKNPALDLLGPHISPISCCGRRLVASALPRPPPQRAVPARAASTA